MKSDTMQGHKICPICSEIVETVEYTPTEQTEQLLAKMKTDHLIIGLGDRCSNCQSMINQNRIALIEFDAKNTTQHQLDLKLPTRTGTLLWVKKEFAIAIDHNFDNDWVYAFVDTKTFQGILTKFRSQVSSGEETTKTKE